MSERMRARPDGLSRRGLLLIGAAGTAGLVGASGVAGQALAAPAPSDDITPMAMVTRNYLETTGCSLYYEPSGNPSNFTFDETYYGRLGYWKNFIYTNAPGSWGSPWRIYSYGAYVNKEGMHGLGRAFDIAKVIYRNTSGTQHTISMRYDQWRNSGNAPLYYTRYWGAAASLMRRFRHVITYKDNTDHHNHIHVDNAIYSLLDDAYYDTGSVSQTYIVQGCTRYVWGHSTAVDGDWGPETESHSNSVLRRIGRASGTITNRNNFWAFCTASFRKAVGTEAY
jgi:hypothetical protein